MDLLEFIPGAFCGLAVADGSLQWIRDSEGDDAEGFFIRLVPFIDFLLDFIPCCCAERLPLFLCVGFFHCWRSSDLAIDDLPYFLLGGKQHLALERPRMVRVVLQFRYPVATSIVVF